MDAGAAVKRVVVHGGGGCRCGVLRSAFKLLTIGGPVDMILVEGGYALRTSRDMKYNNKMAVVL